MNKRSYTVIAVVIVLVLIAGVTIYAINNSRDSANSSSSTSSQSPTVSTLPKGETVTIEGIMTCLVPKDTSGVQDLSCAIGLKTDDGKYYALSASDPTTTGTIPTGQRVTVKGRLSDQNSKYTSQGIIQVESIERI
jgi:hypothetical protein